MSTTPTAGDHPIPGRDADEMWDKLASFAFPACAPEGKREALALLFLNSIVLNPNYFASRALAARRMAEALMGSDWVAIWERGTPVKKRRLLPPVGGRFS